MIFETVVTTTALDGRPHIAPMGVRYADNGAAVLLMPFRPSTTLDNVLATHAAVVNLTTDVRVFAGCVTRRATSWPTIPADQVPSVRLAESLGHLELELTEIEDDAQRPVLRMNVVRRAQHAPFIGFNRAQSAVIEGAILVSRLSMLPAEKIDNEIAYLRIALDKTAGDAERTAWEWLMEAIRVYRDAAPTRTQPSHSAAHR
jgi:hypothetical protein